MAKVVRLDIAIDLEENIDNLFKYLAQKYYRKSNVHYNQDNPETVYFGKYPKLTVLYHDKVKHTSNQSRIEKRYFASRMLPGIETLQDLEVLPLLKPFNDISHIEISEDTPGNFNNQVKLEGIKYLISKNPGSHIIKKLRKNGQLGLLKRYIRLTPNIYSLNDIYQRSMNKFFERS